VIDAPILQLSGRCSNAARPLTPWLSLYATESFSSSAQSLCVAAEKTRTAHLNHTAATDGAGDQLENRPDFACGTTPGPTSCPTKLVSPGVDVRDRQFCLNYGSVPPAPTLRKLSDSQFSPCRRRISVSADPSSRTAPPQGYSYALQSNSSMLPALPHRPPCRAGLPSIRAGTGESGSYERDTAGQRCMAWILGL